MVLGFKLLNIFFYILFTLLTLYKKNNNLCSSTDSAFYMMMMTSLYLAHGHGILCTRLDRLVLLNNGGHFVLTSIVIHSHFGNEFTIVVILKLITSVTFGVHSIFGFVLRPYWSK
jgi:hypothetical protein